MPVAIWLSRSSSAPTLVTSTVRRFYAEERKSEIEELSLFPHQASLGIHRIGKLGSLIEKRILKKINNHTVPLGSLISKSSKHVVYYQEACRYWLKASHKKPKFKKNGISVSQPHGREVPLLSKYASRLGACVLNSSLFYWFYSVFSDCEHVNDSLVRLFPIPNTWAKKDWIALSDNLHSELHRHASLKTINTKQGHVIEYLELDAGKAKSIIDRIDAALGDIYGFTTSELDYVINYDVKYRLGASVGDDD